MAHNFAEKVTGYANETKYLNTGLKAKLVSVLGDKTLNDSHTDLAITSCLVTDDDHPTGVLFSKSVDIRR